LTRIVASSGALVLSGACGGVAPPVVAPSPGRAHVSPSARIAPWLQQPDRLVQQSIFLRVFPGAVLAVGTSKGLVHLRTFGRLTYDPSSEPVATDTIFDLASVTKVVATTAVAAALVSGNRLSLDTPVSRFHPCFVEGGKERVVVRQLLTHSAGLSAWTSLYRDVSGRTAAFDRICALDLEYEPGTRSLYSDLSMDLLAAIIEQATHEGLDTAAETLVFRPLGMNDTLFRPSVALRPRIAPTENNTWRGRLLHGEVHDDNAYAMGGVAGHAGLFGTAPDLARFAQMMLNRGSLDGKRIVSAETIDLFTRRCDVPGSGRALGWNMVDEWAGSFWSERAYGHTGVTGTMIWIDPEYDAFMVLLTNSVYPKYSGDAFRRLRRDVGDAVISAVRMQRQTPKPGS
jgi:CubicO group peptidase (beta-lactamase class C family)